MKRPFIRGITPFGGLTNHGSGQISIVLKPELRGFWGDSLPKPPSSKKATQVEMAILKEKSQMRMTIGFPWPMTDPWDWYIYLHEWLMFMVNVGNDL